MSAQPEPLWIARIAAGQPARLRKDGESVEDYRVAMGWDQPKAKPPVAFTPGPWVQHSLMVSEAGQDIGRGRDICHCGLSMRHDPYESEANARRIVQCVNAHDELVSTLRESRDFVSAMRQETLNSHTNPRTGKPEPSDVVDDEDALLARIDAALAKAGETS